MTREEIRDGEGRILIPRRGDFVEQLCDIIANSYKNAEALDKHIIMQDFIEFSENIIIGECEVSPEGEILVYQGDSLSMQKEEEIKKIVDTYRKIFGEEDEDDYEENDYEDEDEDEDDYEEDYFDDSMDISNELTDELQKKIKRASFDLGIKVIRKYKIDDIEGIYTVGPEIHVEDIDKFLYLLSIVDDDFFEEHKRGKTLEYIIRGLDQQIIDKKIDGKKIQNEALYTQLDRHKMLQDIDKIKDTLLAIRYKGLDEYIILEENGFQIHLGGKEIWIPGFIEELIEKHTEDTDKLIEEIESVFDDIASGFMFLQEIQQKKEIYSQGKIELLEGMHQMMIFIRKSSLGEEKKKEYLKKCLVYYNDLSY